jgi:hypothetical protein
MIGTTLGDIREHIESLADEDGRYYVACARTGCRPVPADELAFGSRASARAAAQATEQYRAALRRYDPQVSYRDIIVREELPGWEASDGTVRGGPRARDLPPAPPESERTDAIEFCHTVASVVFEAIAGSAHVDLQDAIMDTYLEAAEAVESPDELCLRLLESIATELDERLTSDEQASVLREAAANLPTDDSEVLAPEPLAETLDSLASVGLVDDYRIERCSASSGTSRSWTVRIEGYSLDGTPGRVVTLPLVVHLFDRLATRAVTISGAERGDASASWRLSIETNTTGRVGGLVCVPTEECS